MNQPTLFPDDRYQPPSLARQSDPATSHEAAKVPAITTGTARDQMLAAIRYMSVKQNEPPTANEAAARCVTLHCGERETYRKRIGELRACRLVQVAGERECKVTGKRAATFQLSSNYGMYRR